MRDGKLTSIAQGRTEPEGGIPKTCGYPVRRQDAYFRVEQGQTRHSTVCILNAAIAAAGAARAIAKSCDLPLDRRDLKLECAPSPTYPLQISDFRQGEAAWMKASFTFCDSIAETRQAKLLLRKLISLRNDSINIISNLVPRQLRS